MTDAKFLAECNKLLPLSKRTRVTVRLREKQAREALATDNIFIDRCMTKWRVFRLPDETLTKIRGVILWTTCKDWLPFNSYQSALLAGLMMVRK